MRHTHRIGVNLLVVVLVGVGVVTGLSAAPPAGDDGHGDCGDPSDVPIVRGTPRIEVVFVLDTTGSMGALIDGAKQKIWFIADAIGRGRPTPEIHMGLIGFRDRGDDYVVTTTALQRDLDAIYMDLMELEAGGGGDGPESVNQALHEAVTGFGWSDDPGTLKLVYLVGDAPPHMDYADDVPYTRSCVLAADRGIVVNTLQCGSNGRTESVWREIAACSGGSYVAVARSGSVRTRATPFDAELARHSALLDTTLVHYGETEEIRRRREKLDRRSEIDKIASKEALADRATFRRSAASSASTADERDLVRDLSDKRVDWDALPEDRLPESLRRLSAEERRRYVDDMAALRRGLQSEIDYLIDERKRYLAHKTAESEGGFDADVLRALRCQAQRHGISYEAH